MHTFDTISILSSILNLTIFFPLSCYLLPYRSGPLSVTNRKSGTINSTSPMAAFRHSLPGPLMAENIPLPIEMDAESVNGKRLMAAVCQFSATMASHLETYVLTIVCTYLFITKHLSITIIVIFPSIFNPNVKSHPNDSHFLIFFSGVLILEKLLTCYRDYLHYYHLIFCTTVYF